MTFVIPPQTHPRKTYRAEAHPTQEGGWPRVKVTVYRNETIVFTYDRNYSFLKTFEPFRQLRDGVWRDYALISQNYTRLEVLDLSAPEPKIIAVEGPPRVDQAWQDSLAKSPYRAKDKTEAEIREKYPIGHEMPGAGFCPTGFYVPDWWDHFDSSFLKSDHDFDEEYSRFTGEWGIYSGCVWGDDTSWKLQYVDLSRISEGVVTTDDRFGYLEMPAKTDLQHAVNYEPEMDRVSLAVEVHFNRETGKAYRYAREAINWDEATQ